MLRTLARTSLSSWRKTHETSQYLHWGKLDVKQKMDIQNQLGIALSMSSFPSEIPINPRVTYGPVVFKNASLDRYCSRDSPMLLANTRNKKVNWEIVKCTQFTVLVLSISVHGPVTFGELLESFLGVCVILLISVLNSSPKRKTETWMEWVEMEHSTQGIRVRFVVPQQI